MRFEQRVAIVTGAGGGLGRAHALALGTRGARVVAIDVAGAEAVAGEIRAAGGEALAGTASVSDRDAIGVLVERAMATYGRIDILINNAGIIRDKTFAKLEYEDFVAVMDVHVTGAFVCTKAVWDIMRGQNYGRIVMTTSSSGLYGNFGQANYSAAKMALVGLANTLALEGAKYDVRVNALAPTAQTRMTDGRSRNSQARDDRGGRTLSRFRGCANAYRAVRRRRKLRARLCDLDRGRLACRGGADARGGCRGLRAHLGPRE
jgi:NAD(P)-dependent dehydrogenase (short-subunit alcohol dehydrogenase family)